MTDLLDRGHTSDDTHVTVAPVDPCGDGQARHDAHVGCAVSTPSAGAHTSFDPHLTRVAGSASHEGGTIDLASPIRPAPRPREFADLRLAAESFEDAQRARIAIENRLRSGTDAGPVAEALASLEHAEKKLGLAMRRAFRRAAPEVHLWAKETTGVGEHLTARLLGCIGHPVIASPYHWEGEGSDRVLVADEPFARSVSQLWSYCGHGDATRKKRKGMTADEAMALGNPRAKMLVHLIAEGAMKCVGTAIDFAAPMTGSPADAPFENGGGSTLSAPTTSASTRRRSPYRDVYDLGRLTYADRVDAEGKPWTPAHQHNAALRLVGKAVLRDLWAAAA